MSTIWTPSGEHQPEPEATGNVADAATPDLGSTDAATPEEIAAMEELRRIRAELEATPVSDVIMNHVVGLWQLAIIHLTPETRDEPNLAEASLAIDAMAALIEGLGDRMGEHAEPLRESLAQLRLIFVQVSTGRDEPPTTTD